MDMRFGRSLRRAGATAAVFFAASAFAAPAAFAADTTSDLDVQLQGVTLAGGATEKSGSFTVTNNGPQAATNVGFKLDASGLDATKVTFEFDGGDCTEVAKVWDCEYTGTIDAGETWDNWYTIKRIGDATGEVGTLKVTVSHDQDENTDNNSKSAVIELSKTVGVDLVADAEDIYVTNASHEVQHGQAVQPGAQTEFIMWVGNQGSVTSANQKIWIKLPEHVTFVGSEPDCDYETGDTETTCNYFGSVLEADDFDKFWFDVKIDESVAGPVVLGGGKVVVVDVQVAPEARAAAAAPTNRASVNNADRDVTDNSDEFAAYVAKKDGGQGGGLPVTGVQISLIAGIGGAAVIGGGALLLLSRRRRATVA
ncbi:hypothetical protein Rhe02_81770 [Rhizocola hellebori]|uniref:Gram-positive cocci surface proteins LPxTG domain-containing protein n=1 Tax=Rhizocola hellebori TaxID=1392758 RepID=A0A8J3QFW7_9ACTN|nr:LPXTG cell wall anchor domain-containing protein [Rhizocola hellebori]GIH10110.1 hypothetical protein Rhe02_81770 [Rhizocola hellebori]